MSGPVSSAVVSEAVSRITSLLTGKYSEHKNVYEWIHRLEMARIKIKSAVQESEAFDIDIDGALHEWQEKLKVAVCEAEEALSNFQAKILHEKPNPTVEGGSSARDQFMQEEGHDDATLGLPASNLREAVPRQVKLEPNITHDPFMQEEGSDDATQVSPALNLREAITHQVNLEANLPHDPFMQEEGSDDATLVHPASNLREVITHQVNLEANLPHETNSLLKMIVTRVGLKIKLAVQTFRKLLNLHINRLVAYRPVLIMLEPISVTGRIMKSQQKFVGHYLENDEKVSNLIKTVEKLEKTAGDIGDFIELLKLQAKRNMCRKRKRTGVALQGFLLVISLKLQTYALFCYGEHPYLLVIMLFHANFSPPAGITGYIFIGYIM